MKKLEDLTFIKNFSKLDNHEFYSKVDTTAETHQHLISFNLAREKLIGIAPSEQHRDDFLILLVVNTA